MKTTITKTFIKKVSKIKDKKLRITIFAIIQEIELIDNIYEIRNMKKLSGHEFAYRIRIGKYRIGVFIKNEVVEFSNFDHRSKIYKIFP